MSETTEQPAAPAAVAPQLHKVSKDAMFQDAHPKQTSSKQQQATDEPQQLAPDAPQQQEASSKSRAKRSAAAAAAAASIEQQAGSSKARRSSQRLSQPPPAAAAEPEAADDLDADAAAAAAAVAVNGTDSRLAALGVADAEAAPMFLERVVLWWCGIPDASSDHWELQTILHAYAGVRFPDIQEVTTHIMVRQPAALC